MGLVKFISETGFPHSACEISGRGWYGFKPAIPKTPVSKGVIDRSSRAGEIKSSVTLRVSDEKIQEGLSKTLAAYQGAWYRLGMKDCVSFTADLAEAMGLRIPPRPNFLPDELVAKLRRLNAGLLSGGSPVRNR